MSRPQKAALTRATQNSQNKENIINKYGKNIINKDREIEKSAEEAHIVVTGKLFQNDISHI